MKKYLSILWLVFIINFLWEISQMFLYENHTNGFWNFIFLHIKASLGDVVIFLLIYLLGALIFQSKKWFVKENKSKYFIASLLGLIIAIVIERYALATQRWAYNNLMPVIPLLKVGLSPILQMIILPPITILFLEKLKSKNSRS